MVKSTGKFTKCWESVQNVDKVYTKLRSVQNVEKVYTMSRESVQIVDKVWKQFFKVCKNVGRWKKHNINIYLCKIKTECK